MRQSIEDLILNSEPRYRYMLLDRLRTDCEYYLGNGNRNPKNLWAGSEVEQINAMKLLWHLFSKEDKPDWLTFDDILEYQKKMCTDDRNDLQELRQLFRE